MNCPACGHENRDTARFCLSCGAQFSLTCPRCNAELPAGARFCDECGAAVEEASASAPSERAPRDYTPKHLAEKILQSKSALEGERKQVTVLFADVKGSMDLAEQVDPEEWHRILNRFFEILSDGVHRFEGTVNQYTGDGIMALFGAPIAHEDHAQRACYAALHLTEELRRYARELRLERGLSFSVRMGLNSGEVIVGKIGDDLRMDYTAQGHTVGLAARMEQLAEPGKVCLAEDTARLVHGYFEVEDLGPVRVTGIREPIQVFELQGVGALRTRIDVSRMRGFSRFVGRVEEMQALEAALGRAREGQAQVIGVVGEAGAGKSRLSFEFLERCRAEGLTTSEAHGVAHGKATPLVPILELFRVYYGITEQDADRVAREKIAGRLLLLDEAFREVLPLQFEFLGVPDPDQPALRIDPEARQRQLFAVMKRVIQLTGQDQTAVTLLEDLHWFDAGSDAFVEQFVEAIQGTRGLLVLTFRPEYHAGWMQKSYYQQLPLLPLGPEAIQELLDDLLGSDPSLTGLAERVQERTGGNPFFIEEVVQSLVESGQMEGSRGAYRLMRPVAQIAVPDTVQAVLMARIDRLAEREKQVLQTAAVIGKTFPQGVLSEVAELPELDLRRTLEGLKGGEFIYESAIYPALEYTFKHPLTQEVAYGSQLTERRQRIHAAVARTLAELDPEKLDEHAALLAHHWGGAGETLEAARWHRRAAEWVGMSDVAEAQRHWQSVRALAREAANRPGAAELGALACQQVLIMGWRLGLSEAEQEQVFAEGKRWLEDLGDLEGTSILFYAYSISRCTAGDLEAALALALESERIAQEAGNPDLVPVVPGATVVALSPMGRLEEARVKLDYVIDATRERPELGVMVWGGSQFLWAMASRAWLEGQVGNLETAREMLEQTIDLARAGGYRENEAWALNWFGELSPMSGDIDRGLRYCRRGAEIAERVGMVGSRLFAHSSLGLMLLLSGHCEEAAALIEGVLRVARQRRIGLGHESEHLARLAEAYLRAGRLSEARASAEEGIAVGQRIGAVAQQADAQLARARVLLRQDSPATAADVREALARAQALYRRSGARNRQAFVHLERAELAHLQGDAETRERELRSALELFRLMKAPIRVREVEELLAGAE
jgi:class 3 adenylate cyclase/tetratricopeptide (TPR) repeat protein